ncbi:MAG: glycosyltransferase family 4 protein [Phycisphaerae bacterium]|nr:glycosyltransferase family 4 protein [Phycisphaerae bacterium]
MYLVVINVPFRSCGPGAAEVASDWGRALALLRDSFHGRFGPLVVAAPELPPGDGPLGSQEPYRLDASDDGISFVRLGDTRWRARDFWRHHRAIRARCRDLARRAEVVHAGMGNLWQPYAYVGFCAGLKAGITTVFVQDGDAVGRLLDLAAGRGLLHRFRTRLYCTVYERRARRAVARADLSLLKGRAVNARYGRFARNARDFYDTSYPSDDVIPPTELSAKIDRIRAGKPLRCLSLGRLEDFKRVDDSVRAVDAAVRQAVPVQLDIIGNGPDTGRLRALVDDLGAGAHVRFLGARPYGPALLRELRSYHVYLFTSTADETPRSVFDAFAAGCPLLAYALPYTEQVVDETGAGRCVPRGDRAALARVLTDWCEERSALIDKMRLAAAAGADNSADAWYARRAQWTIEAHERACPRQNVPRRSASPLSLKDDPTP